MSRHAVEPAVLDLDGYFEALIVPAQQLIGAVRDRDRHQVVTVLAAVRTNTSTPVGVDPVEALAVVLACLVPDLSSPRELLTTTTTEETV
ncbi:MAG TPA: hypothetical protein VIS06_12425 [Mycobacteriales bacterium]